jgi:beta-galactosidase
VLLALALFVTASVPGRQIVNLDQNWEFIRVPNPPTIWTGPDAVPTSAWRVLHVSSEETAHEDGRATNAFDGNPDSIWHTEWSKQHPGFPHELVIDLGSRVETVGLRLLPRQTSPQNGRPKHFELYLSKDSKDWKQPVLTDSLPNSANLYTKTFPATACHYMRLVFIDGQKPEPFLSLSEIGLIRKVETKDRKGWDSQYNIASVQVGSDRFDLSPAQLEEARARELNLVRDRKWEAAILPHAVWIRPLGTPEIWQGVAYYRRSLDRPIGSWGKNVQLSIEGAMQSSDLWLNGKHIAQRRGGYLPLVTDVTPYLKDRNELLIRVDNRDNPLIPPGKPQKELDFMYGNGLYRHALLTVTSPVHITDPILENQARSGGIYVTYSNVSSKQATVTVRTHIRNAGASQAELLLTHSMIDSSGRIVAQNRQITLLAGLNAAQYIQTLSVSHPRLWFPDTPNLYRLQTTVSEHGKIIDQSSLSIGIRHIEVSRKSGFVINGKPIHLVGTNRHQDYPWVGPALSDAANVRDVVQLRKAGHNIVRLSHYPQSPAFLDACDRLGLLVIPCTAGWQFLNSDPRFVARVEQDIRELIRRDRNHPCIAFWEASLNETYPPAATARRWNAVAKSEAIDGNILTAGDATRGVDWDICYNGWKDDLSRPQDAMPDRPGYIREYGDYEFGGDTSSSRVRIRDGMEKLLQEAWNHVWSLNKFRPQYPWTMGEGTWEMFDSNVPWQYQVSACGIADYFRRPKPSFWFFASQESKEPLVKIAATWQPGAAKRDVVVFTNCQSVQLSINGRVISSGSPQFTPPTDYSKAKPFDGSNTANLKHPPIVFRDVTFVKGTLAARGFVGGKLVASDAVSTAGKPDHLKLWLDDFGVAPTTNDLVFLRAAVVDAYGNTCPEGVQNIKFKVNGDGSLIADEPIPTEMGVASILVRTTTTARRFTVSALSNTGLISKKVNVAIR